MPAFDVAKGTVRGALPILLVSAAGGLVAGLVLGGMKTELTVVQGLLVMIPAFLAIRGSVYGSLGSRLSSALHQGILEPRPAWDRRLLAAAVAAILNGLTATVFAAFVAFGVLTVLHRSVAPLSILVLIALLGGILAGGAMIGTIMIVVFTGYRRGMDPDNLVGPTVTVAGDIFGMLALYIATHIVLWVR